MNDLPTEPSEVPEGFSRLELSTDEVDYLVRYWELQDHGTMFGWAAKMLHDLTKLDEAGWRLCLTKGEPNEDGTKIVFAPDYRQVHFLMEWLAPTADGWRRLPPPAVLDERMKVPPQ